MRGDTGFPVRVRFTKQGKVRFVSHRDVARAFERALRIERLPLAFSQGFSPRPKISFGLALGVGHESRAEYLDFELAEPIEIATLPAVLSAALPDGITVTGVTELAERAPALQEAITAVELRLSFAALSTTTLTAAVEHVWEASALPCTTTRKGHVVVEDLRPSLRYLKLVVEDPSQAVVEVEVATQPRGTRPADLIGVLRAFAGAPVTDGEDRVLRLCQWIERDGARLEPLEADHVARTPSGARLTNKGLSDDRRPDDGDTFAPRIAFDRPAASVGLRSA